MKIQYFGHACFALYLENGAVIVTDPFDPSVTFAPCDIECSIALISHEHFDHNYTGSLRGSFETVRTPGEHIFGDVRITAWNLFTIPRAAACAAGTTSTLSKPKACASPTLATLATCPTKRSAPRSKISMC